MVNENKCRDPAYREGFNDALDFALLIIKDEYRKTKERAILDVLVRIGSTIGEAKGDYSSGYSSKISALLEQVEIKDQLFDEYAAAVHELHKNRPKIKLTEEEIEKKNEKAKAILQELLKKAERRTRCPHLS